MRLDAGSALCAVYKRRLKDLIFLGRASGTTASGRRVHNTRVDLKLKSTLQNVILSRKCTTIRLQCSVTLPVEYSWRYTSGVADDKRRGHVLTTLRAGSPRAAGASYVLEID